jgi:hypothetical protein
MLVQLQFLKQSSAKLNKQVNRLKNNKTTTTTTTTNKETKKPDILMTHETGSIRVKIHFQALVLPWGEMTQNLVMMHSFYW